MERMKKMKTKHYMVRVGICMVSGMLIVSLILGNGVLLRAEKRTREESVYINADANGKCLQTTITERVTNTESNELVEENTYEGNDAKDLPVDVAISYKLEGKEIQPEELAGKSGKVSITVSYTNRSAVQKKINGKKEELYTPFLMATIVVLPAEQFSNIKIDTGKVLGQESNYMVIGYGLPGIADSLNIEDEELLEKVPEAFTITADTTNFEMESTFTYASAEIFSEFDLDDNSILDDVEEGIELLTDSSEELVEGSEKISDSVLQFKKSFAEYAKGEKGLNQGIKKLTKGGKTLQKGINGYVSGTNSLVTGVQTYVSATKKITDGTQSLYNGMKDMPASYSTFSTGLQNYTAAVDALAKEETGTALKNGASAVATGIGTVNTSLTTLEKSYETYAASIATIREQANACTDEAQKEALLTSAEELETLLEGQKATVTALKSATSSESDLKKGADQLSTGVTQMVEGVQGVSANSQTLRHSDAQISAGITSIVENGKKLSEGSNQLSQSNTQLLNGAKKIKKAGKSMKTGGSGLVKGMKKLKKGSNSIHTATEKISDGVSLLNQGTKGLAKGMSQFDKKGIQKLETMYQEDFLGMKNRLSALVDCAKEYKAYTENEEDLEGSVRFIIETEGVKVQ